LRGGIPVQSVFWLRWWIRWWILPPRDKHALRQRRQRLRFAVAKGVFFISWLQRIANHQALLLIKIFAWWYTGSVSILAALVDSLVDIAASLTNPADQPAIRLIHIGSFSCTALSIT
jgi:hypothetical protein